MFPYSFVLFFVSFINLFASTLSAPLITRNNSELLCGFGAHVSIALQNENWMAKEYKALLTNTPTSGSGGHLPLACPCLHCLRLISNLEQNLKLLSQKVRPPSYKAQAHTLFILKQNRELCLQYKNKKTQHIVCPETRKLFTKTNVFDNIAEAFVNYSLAPAEHIVFYTCHLTRLITSDNVLRPDTLRLLKSLLCEKKCNISDVKKILERNKQSNMYSVLESTPLFVSGLHDIKFDITPSTSLERHPSAAPSQAEIILHSCQVLHDSYIQALKLDSKQARSGALRSCFQNFVTQFSNLKPQTQQTDPSQQAILTQESRSITQTQENSSCFLQYAHNASTLYPDNTPTYLWNLISCFFAHIVRSSNIHLFSYQDLPESNPYLGLNTSEPLALKIIDVFLKPATSYDARIFPLYKLFSAITLTEALFFDCQSTKAHPRKELSEIFFRVLQNDCKDPMSLYILFLQKLFPILAQEIVAGNKKAQNLLDMVSIQPLYITSIQQPFLTLQPHEQRTARLKPENIQKAQLELSEHYKGIFSGKEKKPFPLKAIFANVIKPDEHPFFFHGNTFESGLVSFFLHHLNTSLPVMHPELFELIESSLMLYYCNERHVQTHDFFKTRTTWNIPFVAHLNKDLILLLTDLALIEEHSPNFFTNVRTSQSEFIAYFSNQAPSLRQKATLFLSQNPSVLQSVHYGKYRRALMLPTKPLFYHPLTCLNTPIIVLPCPTLIPTLNTTEKNDMQAAQEPSPQQPSCTPDKPQTRPLKRPLSASETHPTSAQKKACTSRRLTPVYQTTEKERMDGLKKQLWGTLNKSAPNTYPSTPEESKKKEQERQGQNILLMLQRIRSAVSNLTKTSSTESTKDELSPQANSSKTSEATAPQNQYINTQPEDSDEYIELSKFLSDTPSELWPFCEKEQEEPTKAKNERQFLPFEDFESSQNHMTILPEEISDETQVVHSGPQTDITNYNFLDDIALPALPFDANFLEAPEGQGLSIFDIFELHA